MNLDTQIEIEGIGSVPKREANDYCDILSTLSAMFDIVDGEYIRRVLEIDEQEFERYVSKLHSAELIKRDGDNYEITESGNKVLDSLS